MKKLLLSLAVMFAVAVTASAQKGKMGVGGTLGYGSEIESLGIGARFHYNIMDQLRIAPSMTYFVKNDGVSSWEISGDAHYLFPVQPNLTLYPIGGLVFTQWNFNGNDWVDYSGYVHDGGSLSDTSFGLNIGGGVQYDLTKNLSLIGELKYELLDDYDQAVISAGIIYHF